MRDIESTLVEISKVCDSRGPLESKPWGKHGSRSKLVEVGLPCELRVLEEGLDLGVVLVELERLLQLLHRQLDRRALVEPQVRLRCAQVPACAYVRAYMHPSMRGR